MLQKLRAIKSHAALIARMLTEFNRARVELAVHWLKKSVPTTFVLNVFVFSVLAVVKYRAKLKLKWQQLTNAKQPEDLSVLCDPQLPLRVETAEPRVLIIAETSIPQCLCYRVQQKQAQLQRLGWHCEIMPWYDPEAAKQRMHFADVVLFYRVPGLPKPLEAIRYAQSLNKIVVYDVDDLIFDRQQLEQKFAKQPEQLSNKEFQNILDGAELYRQAIEACSYAMTTTSTLQTELAKLVKEKQCFVLPNALSDEVYEVMSLPQPAPQDDKVRIIYGSGTRTHDEDFALVADVLSRLLNEHANLEIVILGYLTLPKQLNAFGDRIQRLPMLDFASYLSCLRQADITIAPLESGVFADAKSEIKWFEAAAFKVPAVVSHTATYANVIEQQITGYIAHSSGDWYQYLNDLITDHNLRQKIGKQAYDAVMEKYGREPMAQTMKGILLQIQQNAISKGHLIAKQAKPHKVMAVNVLYAPSDVGGATIVVERIINSLHKDYSDQFELSVVASDVVGTMVNNVREYGWQGVNVTGVGVSMEGEFELNHYSAKTAEIFQELIDQQRPDLIHFHCIQRLTGAVVEVAKRNNIPYVVTVHDGWWLSEYQFMLDNEGKLINPNQLNPLVAVNSATKPIEAIERTRYLSNLLQSAECIFAVSDYQAQIYRDNGFTNVVVNRNGTLPIPQVSNSEQKQTSDSSKLLRVGYLGGVCEHKGYYLIKSVFEQQSFANLTLCMVDIFEERDYLETEEWGATQVEHVGRYKPQEIAEFYQTIDVLLAPSIWPESFGLVTREAALHGVWVVAAQAGGLAEDIIEGETGWSFAMSDANALTAILSDLDSRFDYYQKHQPDLAQSQTKIRLLDQQVSELVGEYKKILS